MLHSPDISAEKVIDKVPTILATQSFNLTSFIISFYEVMRGSTAYLQIGPNLFFGLFHHNYL